MNKLKHQDVTRVINQKIDMFIEQERQAPKVLVISDVFLIELQKTYRETTYNYYRGIPVTTTVRRNIIECF